MQPTCLLHVFQVKLCYLRNQILMLWLQSEGCYILEIMYYTLQDNVSFIFSNCIKDRVGVLKASLPFRKLIPKSTQMYTLYTNLLFYISFTMLLYSEQGKLCNSVSLQMCSLETGRVLSLKNSPKGCTWAHIFSL